MKILSKSLLGLVIASLLIANANAMIQFNSFEGKDKIEIKVTGFLNYQPFGYITKNQNKDIIFHSVFEQMLSEIAESKHINVRFILDREYPMLVRNVRGGNIDVILGVYHQTKMYDGIEYIFPSIINNPITVIMLPNRINEVKNINDLKKLKGAMSSNEILSDFVKEEIEKFKVQNFDDYNKMFEKLFKKEIDYIFASQYVGIIEASKLGIKNKISFSKQTIWNIPMFIGVSKMSDNRSLLINLFTEASNKSNAQQKITDYLIKTINEIELQNQGVVPPAYSVDD